MTTELSNILLYESKGSLKSLWNTYRIFSDRIELEFRLVFCTMVVPKRSFVKVDLFKPPAIRTASWALKLDLADFYIHVGIERKTGLFRRLRFTPGNPNEFCQKVVEWAQQ